LNSKTVFSKGGEMITRRGFIKLLATAGIVILNPLERMGNSDRKAAARAADSYESIGELFAEFVLLAEGASAPGFIQFPKKGIPQLCNVDGSARLTGVVETFNNFLEVASNLDRNLYWLNQDSGKVQPTGGYILSHDSGEIFGIEQEFSDSSSSRNGKDSNISLWAGFETPRPLPLWSIERVDSEDPFINLHKIDFLPSPGVMAVTPYERQFHWFENDIYFMLTVRGSPSPDEAREFVDLLVPAQ
jgi:hypothetical protein